jgi:hypothetical protein
MEEAKRCELKLPVEIKRTARIRCGGRVPTGAIAPRNSVEKENIPPPVRRSARIRGMKWKDYKEASPVPKDYGGSDYSDDRSPSSWAAAERDDNNLYIWDEEPKERTPEGPNGGGNDGGDNGGGDDGGDDGGVLTDKRCIPLQSASVRTPHLFHHGIPKVLVNPQSKGVTSIRSTFTL